MKRSFAVWMETFKQYTNRIENHEGLSHETLKFVFENALAHLVLGWAIIEEKNKFVHKLDASSMYGRFGESPQWVRAQEKVNKAAAKRVAEAEKAPAWWTGANRFEKFATFVTKLLCMSPRAPYETIFNKLADELALGDKGKAIWKAATKSKHGGPQFAEAVARLVGSSIQNVTTMRVAPVHSHSAQYNLSVLLMNVEKSLGDVGFVVGSLYDVDEVDVARKRLTLRRVKAAKK
jgi:hypothetical protein